MRSLCLQTWGSFLLGIWDKKLWSLYQGASCGNREQWIDTWSILKKGSAKCSDRFVWRTGGKNWWSWKCLGLTLGITRGDAINRSKEFRVKSWFPRTVVRSSVSKSGLKVTFEWKCTAGHLKCGTKVEAWGWEIENSKTDESNVGMKPKDPWYRWKSRIKYEHFENFLHFRKRNKS